MAMPGENNSPGENSSPGDGPARVCGAKTRAGTPCQRAPMPNGRCSKHGGKSHPSGPLHPRYRHGYYSRSPLAQAQWGVIRRVLRHEAAQEAYRDEARRLNDEAIGRRMRNWRRGRPRKA